LKKGDLGGFKKPPSGTIYGNCYMCPPWGRAHTQVRPYKDLILLV
jgi:hypothetical protein